MTTKFGRIIKERRMEMGMKISTLSRLSGVPDYRIRDYEYGRYSPKKAEKVALLNVFGIDSDSDFLIEGKLYVWVTKDRYSLPLAVTDNLTEMANITGYTKNYILHLISMGKRNGNPAFVVVEVDDEERNE